MADHDDGALIFGELFFQYFQSFDVQIIGRLVEDHEIGWTGEELGQDHAVAFAARQETYRCHGALGAEQEAAQITDHMAFLTIDDDVVAAVAHHFGDGLGWVELLTQLVEIADFEMLAELDRTFIGFEFAKQQAQQRTLADAVVTYHADAFAAHDLDREFCDDGRSAVAIGNLARLDHPSAGTLGFLHGNLGATLTLGTPRKFLPHALQGSYATLITGAPRLDALTDPHLFFRKSLIEQRVVA